MYHRHYSTLKTPQSQPIPGSAQVPNSAGGYAFAVDDWTRLRRFLILGAEGGTYYIQEQELTVENADGVRRCIGEDGTRVVREVVEVSDGGLAPKNDPALFVLAMCAGLGNLETRRAAFEALPRVARIGTHLFHFARYVEAFRGWGRGLRQAVAAWYLNQPVDKLAYDLVKYQSRDGWSHRDLLRLSHPKAEDTTWNDAASWVVDGTVPESWAPDLRVMEGAVRIAAETDSAKAAALIRDYDLPREVVPTEHLKDRRVWAALLPHMPLTALIRNLGNLSKCGLLAQGNFAEIASVCTRITEPDRLRNARVHPIQVLAALTTYQSGFGYRGSGEWTPVPDVVDALDSAFYLAFQNVEPSGKRLVLALDVSSSMSYTPTGIPALTCATGAAAMAMVTYQVEKQVAIMAFADEFRALDFSRHSRLDSVVQTTHMRNFGGTDCSLPMRWALGKGVEVDAFVVYTDSETWAGGIHPVQALAEYRRKTGIPAKLVVVGMASNGFTIADPTDGGMLDVVGFDASAPAVIGNFVAGKV